MMMERTAVKRNMSVRTPIEGLASIENGGDVIDYLLDSGGLNYSTFVEIPSGIKRNQGRNDWYEAHLVDESGDGIIRYIELEASGDSPAFSDLKRHLKRHGSPINELFTVIAYRKSDEGPLTSPLNDDLTFLHIEEQFSSEDVEVTFNLNYFTVKQFGVEPAYLDYLDDLTVGTGQGRTSLEGDVEDVFSIREVTQRFYQDFGNIFREDLQDAIHGLENPEENLNAYTRTVVNRVLFLLFIEEKGWLDGDVDYVENKYEKVAEEPDKHVYDDFFEPLFFEALSEEGTTESDTLGRIPFLNGGLFERKNIEVNVEIGETFFNKLLSPEEGNNGEPVGFLRRYKISLRESNPSEQELVVDPEFIGRIFEMFMQEAEREEKGTFYTPKPITEYMAKNALKQYLLGDFSEHEDAVIDLVASHTTPTELDTETVRDMRDKITGVQVVDPAVGSGAFIIAMSEELVAIAEALTDGLDEDINRFELKKQFIRDSLYGVDIDSGGIELCKFRVWLYLIQDLHISIDVFLNQNDKFALPNLGLKFFVGNSLVGDYEPTELRDTLRSGDYQGSLFGNYDNGGLIENIATLRQEYVNAHSDEKQEIRAKLQRLTDELDDKISWESSEHWMTEPVDELGDSEPFKWSISVPEVILEGGFDIVIGNPPYKGGTNPDYVTALSDFYEERRDEYVKPVRKMVYDRYQKFIYRGEELVRDDGVFTYIVNSTFRTIATKTSTRNLLQSNRLQEILLTNIDTFDAAVNAAIFSLRHADAGGQNYQMRYVNGLEAPITSYRNLIHLPDLPDDGTDDIRKITDSDDLHAYQVPVDMYRNSIRGSFFEPDEIKQKVYQNYITPANDLIAEWQEELYDVDRQRDNLDKIQEQHLIQLKPGDVTLLGLVTWGGEGLKTNNNKEHIAYIDGTESAEKVKDRNDDFQYVEQNENAYNFINRVIQDEYIINPRELTEEERFNGIDSDERDGRTWVPIEKGASTSDVYYKPTEQYINWSKESLEKISNRRGGRIRDPSYYFRRAVFASRGGAGKYKTKARYINNAVVDSSGVVLVSTTDRLPPKYLLGILNSEVTKYTLYHFINGTLNVQAADMRVIPVPVPTEEQLEDIIESIDAAIAVQKDELDRSLDDVQAEIDEKIADLYELDVEYIPRWY